MKALDLFIALHGIEIEMGFQSVQRSTRSFPRIWTLHQNLLVFVWENSVLFLSLSHWVDTCYWVTSIISWKQTMVIRKSCISWSNWPRLCSSPGVVWVGTDLVISIKPVVETNICQQTHPFHGTLWCWACQCAIKRDKAILGNQPPWQIQRKGLELPETPWSSSLSLQNFFFISPWKVPDQESQKVIEQSCLFTNPLWSSPNLLQFAS